MRKAWRPWGVITVVLVKKEATMWSWGMMYNAVAQLVLLYGSERWVVTGEILKVLEGFHHQASSGIMGMMITSGPGRE